MQKHISKIKNNDKAQDVMNIFLLLHCTRYDLIWNLLAGYIKHLNEPPAVIYYGLAIIYKLYNHIFDD